jgi:hypothetical protein
VFFPFPSLVCSVSMLVVGRPTKFSSSQI